MRVKVQVGEEKLLIPVPDDEDKKIAWLINEVAVRLQKKLKVEKLPEIHELALEDGSCLSPDDAIKGLIESNDLLIAKLSSPASSTNNNAKEIAKAVLEEAENLAKKRAQETILQCVQCGTEFRESENPEGGCKWHTEGLDNYYRTKCCSQKSNWRDHGFLEQYTPGCQRGKHRATHHEDYTYRNYTWWANDLLRNMTKWCEVDRKDYNDQGSGWRKYAKIGLHSGKIVVALGINYTPKYIRVYSDLKAQELVVKEFSDEKLGWKLSVTPHKQNSGEVFVDLTVKCASDPQPEILRVVVSFNEASKEFSASQNVEKISSANVAVDTSKIYDLPPAKFSGKRIHPSLFEKGPTPRTFKATGDLPLTLFVEEGKKVRPCQSSWGGKFKNLFESQLMFTHDSEDVTTVTSVKGEFFVNGEWVPAAQALLGFDGWNSPTYENTLPAVFEGKKSAGKIWANLAYEFPPGTIQQGENDNRGRAWCHTSLGNPLLMRFTLIASDGKTKTIELEHVNPPLDSTPVDANTCFVLECPNATNLTIPFTRFALKKGEEYWLEYKNGSTTSYTDDSLMRWAWQAKNAKEQVYKLDDLCKKTAEDAIEVYALVDVTLPRVYGFKVYIKSATGEAEDSFQFWKDEPEKTRVSSKVSPLDWKPEYAYEPATPTPNAN